MIQRISEEKMSRVFSLALQNKIIDQTDSAVILHDLSYLKERVIDLVNSFPESTLHAVAIKANPLTKILSFLKSLNVGLEAATLPELYLAEKAGFSKNKIVFDSPVKTIDELEYAMELGIHINADSIDELNRIAELLKKWKSTGTFGIRINPQVGTGSILSTSVAGEFSKFGVPINEYRNELIDCFLKYDWLTGVHLHIGSQGCALHQMVEGVKILYDFTCRANEILGSKECRHRIEIFDIGGGLPVSYHKDKAPITMADFKKELKAHCPGLFQGEYKLITEFGRYLHANTGWTVSRVEYMKHSNNIKTAMIHVGADLLLRRCYRPEDWHHEIAVLDSNGHLKKGKDSTKYVIAGPLCFAGDLIAKEIELPPVEEGDYIIIEDTGAYTLSMWSRYNSRQIPKVLGYHNDGDQIEILKEREKLESLRDFWS
jgi:diaminopimelate decarboxylase